MLQSQRMKMRPLTIILFTLFLFACVLAYVSGDRKSLRNQVVVRKLDLQLPAKEEQIHDFLWSNFANKPEEEKFEKLTTEEWKDRFHEYEKTLVGKAKWKSLDGDSLKKCLGEAFKHSKDELAYLPVGAYSTKQGTTPVWIIVVKWETAKTGENLGHVRMFAFDAQSMKLIGFASCM